MGGGHPCHDRMVVGFTTTCAISTYHNSIQHYMIKIVSDLRQIGGGFLRVREILLKVEFTLIICVGPWDIYSNISYSDPYIACHILMLNQINCFKIFCQNQQRYLSGAVHRLLKMTFHEKVAAILSSDI